MSDAPEPKFQSTWAWLSRWVQPFEGPLSLLWKFAWTNSLNASETCKSLFGKALLPDLGQARHGRSLLMTHWMSGGSNVGVPGVAGVIEAQGMQQFAPNWVWRLASDARIRLCPVCADVGYQTIFAQLDGLARCPIHDMPLQDTCMHCSQSTPRYALTIDTMKAPWHCPHCGKFYGRVFRPKSWMASAEKEDEIRWQLQPLAQWLRRINGTQLSWPGYEEWLDRWRDTTTDREKRVATFVALSSIVPLCLPAKGLAQASRTMLMRAGKSFAVTDTDFFQMRAAKPNPTRIAIYKAIRRHLFRRSVGHCAIQGLRKESARYHLGWRDDALLLSHRLCPKLQAILLWRLRMEEVDFVANMLKDKQRELRLREATLNWPSPGAADDGTWAFYVLASAHASFDIVAAWWARAEALQDADIYGSDRVRAMTLYAEFAPLLSPIKLPVSPHVTVLFDSSGKHRTEYGLLAIASVSRQSSLRECSMCCRNRRTVNESGTVMDGVAADDAMSGIVPA